MASGSTIVDPDQHGSRRTETAGIAADPVARLSTSLLFFMAMRITVDVAHHSLGVRFGSKADINARQSTTVRKSIPHGPIGFPSFPAKTSSTTGRLTSGHARVRAGHRSGVRACKEVHDSHQLGPVCCRGTGKTGGRLSIYQCPPWSLSKKFYTKKSCLHCSQCVHVLSHC